MKLDLNFKLMTRAGKEIDDKPASQILANNMDTYRSKDPRKSKFIADKLYENGVIDLDSSDMNFLEEVIKGIQFVDAVAAPILNAIDEARIVAKESAKNAS